MIDHHSYTHAIPVHRYRRGHGFESRSGLNFFQTLISQLLKLYPISQYSPLALIVIKIWGKLIERPWVGGTRIPFLHEFPANKGRGRAVPLPHWRWSENERRGSVSQYLLYPQGFSNSCTCITHVMCITRAILRWTLRALILSVVNSVCNCDDQS